MRQIKEVLRLHYEAYLSERQIAHACRVSRSTVQRYLERAAAANLDWPLPESLDESQLERQLFPPPAHSASEGRQPPKSQPDFARIHQELQANKSVTLQLLWQEFVEEHPDGAHYSWFCQQYRDWRRHLDVVLRQDHRAGEKTFVDHAGDTIQVIDRAGQKRPAYVFVAVLGASNYTYAEATWTRGLPDWIGSHTTWKKERVRLDYHVEVDGHYYSVPYQLAQQVVEIRSTATTVEMIFRGKRVASHARSWEKPGTTTETSHQPKSHQRYREWTPTRLLEWTETIGPFTRQLVEAMLIHKPHPEAGYRAAMGLRPLASQYGDERLEAAATRAVRSKLYRLENIRSILKTRLDQQPLPILVTTAEPVTHDNIRGAAYYSAVVEEGGVVEVAG